MDVCTNGATVPGADELVSEFASDGRPRWRAHSDCGENEFSLKEGLRLFSVYRTNDGTKFWIITEADLSAIEVRSMPITDGEDPSSFDVLECPPTRNEYGRRAPVTQASNARLKTSKICANRTWTAFPSAVFNHTEGRHQVRNKC